MNKSKYKTKKFYLIGLLFFAFSLVFPANKSMANTVYDSYCSSKKLSVCSATCSLSGAWCDANPWSSYCAGTWSNVNSFRDRSVECCSATDCPAQTCKTKSCSSSNTCSYSNVANGTSCGTGMICNSGSCVEAVKYYDSDGGIYINDRGAIADSFATIAVDSCVRRGDNYSQSGIIKELYLTSLYSYSSTELDCGSRDVRLCDGTYSMRYAICRNNPPPYEYSWSNWAWCGGVVADCTICTPNNCASNTCIDGTCNDGCNYVAGTMSCSCTGTAPNGTTQIMCTGDDTTLTSTLAWSNVGTTPTSCTSTRKCEYYTPPVIPAPTVSLSTNPSTINSGASATLTWTTTNAASCWGWDTTGTWDGWKSNTGGTFTVNNITSSRAYSIQCWNSNGVPSSVSSANVLVVPPPPPCTTDNSCATSTCIGNVCYDSCGTSYPGTRNCNWIET